MVATFRMMEHPTGKVMYGWLSSILQIKIKNKRRNIILPVIMKFCGPSIQKEISKQKQKCSYLFVQIKWEEALLRDYVNVINSLSSRVSPQQRPAQRSWIFMYSKRVEFFSVFQSCCCYVTLVKYLVFYRCHFSTTFHYILERSTYNGQKSGDAEAAKTSACLWKCWFCWRCCNICYSTY